MPQKVRQISAVQCCTISGGENPRAAKSSEKFLEQRGEGQRRPEKEAETPLRNPIRVSFGSGLNLSSLGAHLILETVRHDAHCCRVYFRSSARSLFRQQQGCRYFWSKCTVT